MTELCLCKADEVAVTEMVKGRRCVEGLVVVKG